jgi:hypothetical protein
MDDSAGRAWHTMSVQPAGAMSLSRPSDSRRPARAWPILAAWLAGACAPTIPDPTSDDDGPLGPSFEDLVFQRFQRVPGDRVRAVLPFEGALYAVVEASGPGEPGLQPRILRLADRDAAWTTELEVPPSAAGIPRVLGPSAVVAFETFADGTATPEPEPRLVVGAGHRGPDPSTPTGPAELLLRGPTGSWSRVPVDDDLPRPCDGRHDPRVTAVARHHDPSLGRDLLFVGTATGRVFRAAFDLDAPGDLRVAPTPLLQGAGPVSALLDTPEGLLAAITPLDGAGACRTTTGLPEGLLRYVDGSVGIDASLDPAGAFVSLGRWDPGEAEAPVSVGAMAWLDDPDHPRAGALYTFLDGPGRILRWHLDEDPVQLEVAVDLRADLGAEVSPEGPIRVGAGGFVGAHDPASGRWVHLLGIQPEMPMDEGASLLVRDPGEGWRVVRIPSPDGAALGGVSAIAPSPFPVDRDLALYLGGGPASEETTGWLLRGFIPWDGPLPN